MDSSIASYMRSASVASAFQRYDTPYVVSVPTTITRVSRRLPRPTGCATSGRSNCLMSMAPTGSVTVPFAVMVAVLPTGM